MSVLPYRFGTHSGWLEACRDLGTTVVAPDCGYYADQGPVLTYRMDEHRYDADSLAPPSSLRARTLPRRPTSTRAATSVRGASRPTLALYRRLLA